MRYVELQKKYRFIVGDNLTYPIFEYPVTGNEYLLKVVSKEFCLPGGYILHNDVQYCYHDLPLTNNVVGVCVVNSINEKRFYYLLYDVINTTGELSGVSKAAYISMQNKDVYLFINTTYDQLHKKQLSIKGSNYVGETKQIVLEDFPTLFTDNNITILDSINPYQFNS